jgi:hypothetical protein
MPWDAGDGTLGTSQLINLEKDCNPFFKWKQKIIFKEVIMSVSLGSPSVGEIKWYGKPLFGEFGRIFLVFLYYLSLPLGYMIFVFGISLLLGIVLGILKIDTEYPNSLFAILLIPYIFIHIYLRRIYVRRWHAPNIEWSEWLQKSKKTNSLDQAPVIESKSYLKCCLDKWPLKLKRSGQYQFNSQKEASIFCNRHRESIVLKLRKNVGGDSGESRLGIGQLQVEKDHVLLIFRQVSDECCLFFTVRHYQTGLVVNLLTNKWFLINRENIPDSIVSDYEFAKKNSKNEIDTRDKTKVNDNFKNIDTDYGLLGVWHWVHYHSFGNNGYFDAGFAESELNYYESIVHVETLKEAMEAYLDGPAQYSFVSKDKDKPAEAEPEKWL